VLFFPGNIGINVSLGTTLFFFRPVWWQLAKMTFDPSAAKENNKGYSFIHKLLKKIYKHIIFHHALFG